MFRPVASLACALLVTGAVASQANAARLFFSTQPLVNPGFNSTHWSDGVPVVGNPTINVEQGQTVDLHLWVQVNPEDTFTGVGLTLRASQSGIVAADAFTLTQVNNVGTFDPAFVGGQQPPSITFRWQGIGNGELNPVGDLTALVKNANAVQVTTGAGIKYWTPLTGTAFDPTRKDTTQGQAFYLGQLTLDAQSIGSTELFFEVGQGTFAGLSLEGDLFFGTGDASVNGAVAGSKSINADATINVTAIPEPASLGLLAIGGLMMIARRRRA